MPKKILLVRVVAIFVMLANVAYNFASITADQSADSDFIARWMFNENAGETFTDSSPDQFVGTVHGATWSTGLEGSALHFDGYSAYATVEDNPLLRQKNMMIEVWFMPDELRTCSLVIKRIGTDGFANWQIELISGGKDVRFSYYEGVWRTYDTTGGPISHPGYWYHVVTGIVDGIPMTYVNGEKKPAILYFNGVAQPNGTVTPDLNTSYSGDVMLGNGYYGFFRGTIDELTLYNWSLPAEVIKERFKNRNTALPPTNSNPDTKDDTFYWFFKKEDIKAMCCSFYFWAMLAAIAALFYTAIAFSKHRASFEGTFKKLSLKEVSMEMHASSDRSKVGLHVEPTAMLNRWLKHITSDESIKKKLPKGYATCFKVIGTEKSYAVLGTADLETQSVSTSLRETVMSESYRLNPDPRPDPPKSYWSGKQKFVIEASTKSCPNCHGKATFKCEACRGAGKWSCTRCKGAPKIQCPDCKGEGKVHKTETCTYCDGYYPKYTCSRCGGSGKISRFSLPSTDKSYFTVEQETKRDRKVFGRDYIPLLNVPKPLSEHGDYVLCAVCNGSGYLICPECKGKGAFEKDYICVRCHGNKEIKCPDCKEGTVYCKHCGGKGYNNCYQCKGHGKLLTLTEKTWEYSHRRFRTQVGPEGMPKIDENAFYNPDKGAVELKHEGSKTPAGKNLDKYRTELVKQLEDDYSKWRASHAEVMFEKKDSIWSLPVTRAKIGYNGVKGKREFTIWALGGAYSSTIHVGSLPDISPPYPKKMVTLKWSVLAIEGAIAIFFLAHTLGLLAII